MKNHNKRRIAKKGIHKVRSNPINNNAGILFSILTCICFFGGLIMLIIKGNTLWFGVMFLSCIFGVIAENMGDDYYSGLNK